MRSGAVSFKWDRGFWPGVMTSGEMRDALQSAAARAVAPAPPPRGGVKTPPCKPI